ncbi:type VI secretion system Vgr family protein [Burkholderia gladioli]|uniref:type VI secretion system Vgr family protein n=1 Tax=Burkholderia gladioli TaxID=28095 RepID=UPI000F543349|nr:type VI secretion system Vgr family protein [Burkholderia gladioli]
MSLLEDLQRLGDGLVQRDRLLKLDTPLGDNALLPYRVVGQSRIGRDFEFTLDVVSTRSTIELKTLIAQPLTLWIQQSDRSYRPHHGYIQMARRLGADGGLTFHQLGFASWLHFLKFRRDQRIWQDKPIDAIIADVLGAHPQAQGMFRFDVARPLPSLSFCRQNESDWNFVHRLMESEGLFGFWKTAPDGKSHNLTITDRLTALDAAVPLSFYRGGTHHEVDALTQWAGTRSLQSTSLSTRTFDYKRPSNSANPKGTSLPTMPNQGDLPEQAEVYIYSGAYAFLAQQRGDDLSKLRVEEWESRAKRYHGSGAWRAADAGARFSLDGHPEHDRDPASQRRFATIETRWSIENNLPFKQAPRRFPHDLRDALDDARAREAGNEGSKVTGTDGAEGFFLVEIEAQRDTVPFRSPFEHEKPQTHLESAIVVGAGGEEIYTDELNRIKVQFIWDRLNGRDERASCWVRVAQSDTGDGYGGVHMPRVGEEVLIDYIGGDCDRPVVTARLYNGAAKPQWHSHGLLSGFRSKEYGGTGFNQLVMDDSTGQGRAQLYSSSYNSHLHLGYLVQHTGNARGAFLGSGFDLKSEAHGAIRAEKGIYISTHPASAAQPLNMQPVNEQLINSESVIEAVSEASVAAQAESLRSGQDMLRRFTDATRHSVTGSAGSGGRTAGGGTGNANGFAAPVMLMASPAGIALSTPQTTHLSADQHVNLVSGEDTYLATGKSLIASVVEKISLFVQKAGIKLFAAGGKIELWAQNDAMSLTSAKDLTLRSAQAQIALAAAQDVKISSAQGPVTVAASQGITLTSGEAYVKIANGNIELGCPGSITLKSANFHWEGPASLPHTDQLWPGQIPANFSSKVIVDKQLQERIGAGAAAIPYQFIGEDGAMIAQGTLDEMGATQRVFHPSTDAMHVLLGEKGPWHITEHADDDLCGCGEDHSAAPGPGFTRLADDAATREDATGDAGNDEGPPLQAAFDADQAPQVDAQTLQFQRSLIEQLVFNDPAIRQAIQDGED